VTDGKPLVLEFPAPGVPPSENAVRGQHWAQVREALKPWRDVAWVACRNEVVRGHVPWLGHRAIKVQVVLTFAGKNRRDPHNYVGTVVKAIVDGLVRAGLVPDDTPEWVEVLEPILVVTKDPTVRVNITERNPTT
jgi:crossover junction endodeoxyribonuclease RusA